MPRKRSKNSESCRNETYEPREGLKITPYVPQLPRYLITRQKTSSECSGEMLDHSVINDCPIQQDPTYSRMNDQHVSGDCHLVKEGSKNENNPVECYKTATEIYANDNPTEGELKAKCPLQEESSCIKTSPRIPLFIEKRIQILVRDHPEGISIERFSNTYRTKYGSYLIPKEYGFKDVVDLLEQLADVTIQSQGSEVTVQSIKKDKSDKMVTSGLNPELELVAAAFQTLLQNSKGVIMLEALLPEYEILTGEKLDVHKLGFNSIYGLVGHLTDVFKIFRHDDQRIALYDASMKINLNSSPENVNKDGSDPNGFSRILKYETAKRLRALVEDDFPRGLAIEELLGAYKGLYGANLSDLHHKLYGYLTLEALLAAHPEVVSLQRRNGRIMVISNQAMCPKMYDQDRSMPEIPPEAVEASAVYAAHNVKDLMIAGKMVDVVIGEVYSPHRFWVIHRGVETSQTLDNLMDSMFEFYSSPVGCRYEVPSDMVLIGAPVVTLFAEDNNFYRALVTSIEDIRTVKLFFVDYGTVCRCDRSSLRLIHKKFFKLPPQAIKATLDDVDPVGGHRLWPRDASLRFLHMVQNRGLVAEISSCQETTSMRLWDTSGEKDVCINHMLMVEGWAVPRSLLSEVDASVLSNIELQQEENKIPACPSLNVDSKLESTVILRPSVDTAPRSLPGSADALVETNPPLRQQDSLKLMNPFLMGDSSTNVIHPSMQKEWEDLMKRNEAVLRSELDTKALEASGYEQGDMAIQSTNTNEIAYPVDLAAVAVSNSMCANDCSPVFITSSNSQDFVAQDNGEVTKEVTAVPFTCDSNDIVYADAKTSENEMSNIIAVSKEPPPGFKPLPTCQMTADSNFSTEIPSAECTPISAHVIDETFYSDDEYAFQVIERKQLYYVLKVLLDASHEIHVLVFGLANCLEPYVFSADISKLLWENDILQSVLEEKGQHFPMFVINSESDEETFTQLERFCSFDEAMKGPSTLTDRFGCLDEVMKEPSTLTAYHLSSVPKILEYFAHSDVNLIKSLKMLDEKCTADFLNNSMKQMKPNVYSINEGDGCYRILEIYVLFEGDSMHSDEPNVAIKTSGICSGDAIDEATPVFDTVDNQPSEPHNKLLIQEDGDESVKSKDDIPHLSNGLSKGSQESIVMKTLPPEDGSSQDDAIPSNSEHTSVVDRSPEVSGVRPKDRQKVGIDTDIIQNLSECHNSDSEKEHQMEEFLVAETVTDVCDETIKIIQQPQTQLEMPSQSCLEMDCRSANNELHETKSSPDKYSNTALSGIAMCSTQNAQAKQYLQDLHKVPVREPSHSSGIEDNETTDQIIGAEGTALSSQGKEYEEKLQKNISMLQAAVMSSKDSLESCKKEESDLNSCSNIMKKNHQLEKKIGDYEHKIKFLYEKLEALSTNGSNPDLKTFIHDHTLQAAGIHTLQPPNNCTLQSPDTSKVLPAGEDTLLSSNNCTLPHVLNGTSAHIPCNHTLQHPDNHTTLSPKDCTLHPEGDCAQQCTNDCMLRHSNNSTLPSSDDSELQSANNSAVQLPSNHILSPQRGHPSTLTSSDDSKLQSTDKPAVQLPSNHTVSPQRGHPQKRRRRFSFGCYRISDGKCVDPLEITEMQTLNNKKVLTSTSSCNPTECNTQQFDRSLNCAARWNSSDRHGAVNESSLKSNPISPQRNSLQFRRESKPPLGMPFPPAVFSGPSIFYCVNYGHPQQNSIPPPHIRHMSPPARGFSYMENYFHYRGNEKMFAPHSNTYFHPNSNKY